MSTIEKKDLKDLLKRANLKISIPNKKKGSERLIERIKRLDPNINNMIYQIGLINKDALKSFADDQQIDITGKKFSNRFIKSTRKYIVQEYLKKIIDKNIAKDEL